MLPDPDQIVSETLTRLEERLRARDVEGAVACFVPNGAIYGDGLGEQAHGAAELRSVFADLLAGGETIGWQLEEPHALRTPGSIWFVGNAFVVVYGPDGEELQRHAFRLAGTLRGHHGFWRFELFNGTMPLIGAHPVASTSAPTPGLRLVAGGRAQAS